MEKTFLLEHRMKAAEDFEAAGKYLHAIQVYAAVIEENPSYSEAVLKTASLYRKIGNTDAAENLLNDFLSEYPGNKEAVFYLGEFLLNNARWDEAVDTFSIFTTEEEPVTAFFKGYANFMLNEYEIAKINFNEFTSFVNQGELLYEAFFFLAKIEIELKRYEEALQFLKKAEPSLSNFWEYNYLSALCFFNLGMNAHAVTFAEKSISLNPSESIHYNLAGRILLKLGDYPKAEKTLRRYIEMKQNVGSDTYTCLAEACLHNRKPGEAIELFDKALSVDPENKFALDGKRNASDYLRRNQKASDG